MTNIRNRFPWPHYPLRQLVTGPRSEIAAAAFRTMTIRDLVRTLISPGIVAAVVLACPAGRPVGDAFAATESRSPPIRATDPGVPIADHYQHLLSPAADAWEKTKSLPLTTDELRTIAGNVAPYLH